LESPRAIRCPRGRAERPNEIAGRTVCGEGCADLSVRADRAQGKIKAPAHLCRAQFQLMAIGLPHARRSDNKIITPRLWIVDNGDNSARRMMVAASAAAVFDQR
jgi:hypothetical protein